jgi:3-oxoadipate enol-lactonase
MERTVESDHARISYSVEGPSDAPALLLSNSIGTTRDLWARQTAALTRTFRVIRYDTRGHGESSVPDGDYSLEHLGRDAIAILDRERVASAHVCGLSLGGVTAMWLGLRVPDRVSSLVLANTGARLRDEEFWSERIALVRDHGTAALADRAVMTWFSEAFRERDPDTVHAFRAMLQDCPPGGYAGCCAALRDADLREEIGAIHCPTLVIGGSSDTATPLTLAEFMRDRIAGARLVTLDAAHLSNVEQADAFTDAMMEFLGAQVARA